MTSRPTRANPRDHTLPARFKGFAWNRGEWSAIPGWRPNFEIKQHPERIDTIGMRRSNAECNWGIWPRFHPKCPGRANKQMYNRQLSYQNLQVLRDDEFEQIRAKFSKTVNSSPFPYPQPISPSPLMWVSGFMQLSHCTERIEESLFNDYWFACLTFNDNVWVDKLESIDTAPIYKDIINLCCFSILNSWVASALWVSVFSCLFCKAVTAIKVKMIISIRVTLSISYIFSPKTILKWLFLCIQDQ